MANPRWNPNAYLHVGQHVESVTKTVALSEDAYASLERLKKPGQSFSDVVQELVRERRPRLAEVLEEPDEGARDHWTSFQEERRAARREHASRVDLED